MKYLITLAIACFAIGCNHSEFDVSPDQVVKKQTIKGAGKGGFLDMKHLPPGAVVNTMKFKKGDQLPDGRIADGDVELKRIEIPAKNAGDKKLITEDIEKKGS